MARAVPSGRPAVTLRTGARPGTWITSYLFLLPALTIYLIFLVYPIFNSLWVSLHEWDGLSPDWRFIGLENYRRLFLEDTVALLALRNNVIWVAFKLLVPTVLGLLLAVALNRAIVGRTVLRAIFYAPGVLPLVAVGIIWAWIYNPNFGFLNEILKLIGLGSLARGWLSDYSTAFAAVMITSVWYGTGFPMVLYLAGLQGIPTEQYEAAKIDGANALQTFRYITIPGLRETHVIVVTLAVINSFRTFDIVYSMTNGGPGRETQVLALWMYQNTFQYSHAGYGSALAWAIALISLVVTIPYVRRMSK
jgi:raffinose/stachyose/melibiose transport system permease protein